MKKTFLSISAALSLALLSSGAIAQSDALYARTTRAKAPSATASPTSKPPIVKVNARVLRSFSESFGNNNAQWFTQGKEYVARFHRDGRPAHALFAKNGFMYYSVTMGAEKDLPTAVRRLIKSRYVDFVITHVTEVRAKGRTAWMVSLQDDRNLISVRVVDGEQEETASYTLSIPKK